MCDTVDDTPWPGEEETEAWIRLVLLVLRLPLELDRQLQRDSGLSMMEYFVLSGLSETPERSLRMSTLATLTGSQAPRMSQLVSRMEARGWVARRPDPDDGRSTLATLTEDGYQVLVDAAPGHVRLVRRLIFDPLSKAQVSQLAAIAGRIDAAIDPSYRIPGRSG